MLVCSSRYVSVCMCICEHFLITIIQQSKRNTQQNSVSNLMVYSAFWNIASYVSYHSHQCECFDASSSHTIKRVQFIWSQTATTTTRKNNSNKCMILLHLSNITSEAWQIKMMATMNGVMTETNTWISPSIGLFWKICWNIVEC